MLVEHDHVAVWIGQDEVRRPGGISVCFGLKGDPLLLEVGLNGAHVSKGVYFLGVGIPTGVKGQNVVLEHALEQADDRGAAFHRAEEK